MKSALFLTFILNSFSFLFFFCSLLEFVIPSSKGLETYFDFEGSKAERVGLSAGI